MDTVDQNQISRAAASTPVTSVSGSDYFRLLLHHVPASLESDVVNICFKHGSLGVAEDLAFKQRNLAMDPDILRSKTIVVNSYFDRSPPPEFFEEIKNISAGITVEQFQEKPKDWLEEWKKGFTAFKLIGDYWVVPSWEKMDIADHFAVKIDPGMAFGTGTHATTKMMAHFVWRLSRNERLLANSHKKPSYLDVGAGSGILSILAKKCGFNQIVGIETDPIARDVARHNYEINFEQHSIVMEDAPLEEYFEKFDVVGANIIDGVLLHLKSHLLRSMKPGGYVLLSGILLEREQGFITKFLEGTQLEVDRRIESDGWVSYCLRNQNQ